MDRKVIGELLIEGGADPAVIEQALDVQEIERGRLGDILLAMGAVTEDAIAIAMAAQLGLKAVDPAQLKVDPKTVWRVNRELAESRLVLPVERLPDGAYAVVMAEPQSHEVLLELEFALKGRVHRLVSSPGRLRHAIARHYSVESVAQRLLKDVPSRFRDLSTAPTALRLDPARLSRHIQAGGPEVYVDVFNALLINAIEFHASDIHLDPHPDHVRVRYRIDGLLREMVQLPAWAQKPMVGRIKVVGKMDVAERRAPQDGKAQARLGGRDIELRISTLPTQYGEAVVIRLLDPALIQTSLADLGWPPSALQAWYRMLSSPRGTLLVVGPTGCGKSTTLYASIHRLNQEQTSIVTIEDPIEYTLPGPTQVQVNEKAGITFASSIRAMLRQDPDVIVIGEIRDEETAAAAVDAAATGHLVLSTLHTSNAVAAVSRLLDLQVPPYMLGGALTGVVSQRLLRRVCASCGLPANPTPEAWRLLGTTPVALGGRARRAGPGCPACQYMGYSGRVGVFEVLDFDSELGQAVQEEASDTELWELVLKDGFRTLFEDAIEKVRAGLTTLEEVGRVVPVRDYPERVIQATLARLRQTLSYDDNRPLDPDDEPVTLHTGDFMPVGPVTLPPGAIEAILAEATTEPEPLPRAPHPKRLRPQVLIVDDAVEIRQVVGMTLEDAFSIRTAVDGVDAMAQIAEELPDLVVLDVMMPRMTGYEVSSALKASPRTAKIPVLMLSARGETAHVKEGFHAGADDYLPKPFDPEELLLRASALVRRAGWT